NDLADSGRVLETVAGTCRDHENTIVTRVAVDDETSIGSDSVETGGRLGNAGRRTCQPPLYVRSVHLGRLRRTDLAVDGVRGGQRLILLGGNLDAAIARQRRKAVEIVDVSRAMHPDESRSVRPVSCEIVELVPVKNLTIDRQKTVEWRA